MGFYMPGIFLKTGYHLQHLHDFFSMHPNIVFVFYDTILDVFSSNQYSSRNLINIMFFDYCLLLLPEGNSKNKFSFFKKEFQNCNAIDLKNYTNIFFNLNPCNLFSFEN
jgi:hypothetical protein